MGEVSFTLISSVTSVGSEDVWRGTAPPKGEAGKAPVSWIGLNCVSHQW